jgi:hypothetical protein
MANASTITAAHGLREGRIYTIDVNGYPDGDQTGTVGYDGTKITGIQSLSLTNPSAQKITHIGDDVVFAQDIVAPGELPSATMNTGKTNLDLDAIMNSTSVQNIGEAQMGLLATNKDSCLDELMVMYYRQAKDVDDTSSDFGLIHWNMFLFASSKILPRGIESAETQTGTDVNAYDVTPDKVTQTPWGVTLTDVDNGASNATIFRFTSEYPLRIERWDASGTVLGTNWTPISTAKTMVWSNGTELTVNAVNTTTKQITLGSSVGTSDKVVALYETSDGACS